MTEIEDQVAHRARIQRGDPAASGSGARAACIYPAVKIFMPAGAKKPVYAPYVEHVPPNTTAAIFWLKNRDPARWRDAWQVEHTLGKYLISDKPMSEADWARERATLIDVAPEEDTHTLPVGRDESKKQLQHRNFSHHGT